MKKRVRILAKIMKQRIDIKGSKEKLDSFLKEKYGYGIWEFEFSLAYTHGLFSEKEDQEIHKFIEKRVQKLESIKRKIIELLDDFLIEINFYDLNNKLNFTKTTKWTPQKRANFIIKNYKLSQFSSVIDGQIKKYKDRRSLLNEEPPLVPFTVHPIYLKPINLVVLIWSYAMKKGKKTDWINMENLFNWFSKNLDEVNILDFFGLEKCNAPSSETLRLTRNKYKYTKYNILAIFIFRLFFKEKRVKDEGKEKFPKPLIETEEFLKGSYKGIKNKQLFLDVLMISYWLIVFDQIEEQS